MLSLTSCMVDMYVYMFAKQLHNVGLQQGVWLMHIFKFFCLILIYGDIFQLDVDYVCLTYHLAVIVCKYVAISIIMNTHTHTHYRHTYSHIHTHTHTHTYTYIHSHTRTHIDMHTNRHINTYTCTIIHSYIHTYIHTHQHIHMYDHTYIHTHTSTHTHVQSHIHTEGVALFNNVSAKAILLSMQLCYGISY